MTQEVQLLENDEVKYHLACLRKKPTSLPLLPTQPQPVILRDRYLTKYT